MTIVRCGKVGEDSGRLGEDYWFARGGRLVPLPLDHRKLEG